jgi:hypothetical protein
MIKEFYIEGEQFNKLQLELLAFHIYTVLI